MQENVGKNQWHRSKFKRCILVGFSLCWVHTFWDMFECIKLKTMMKVIMLAFTVHTLPHSWTDMAVTAPVFCCCWCYPLNLFTMAWRTRHLPHIWHVHVLQKLKFVTENSKLWAICSVRMFKNINIHLVNGCSFWLNGWGHYELKYSWPYILGHTIRGLNPQQGTSLGRNLP